MYKRLLLAAFTLLSLIVSPLLSLSAQALSPAPYLNSLIRIEGNPSVYWRALDGKRYVFPNARTFYSWFSPEDLNRVIVISPYEMGQIAIGGNVTYRPGARLIKITTDPRVYAVSRYGVLRWVTSEALAAQLYGQNWAQQVDDVPDQYFTNYRTGEAIYSAQQFNVQFELGQARSPSDNIQSGIYWPNPTDNTNPLVGSVTLSVSNAYPALNESVTFTATAYNIGAAVQYVTTNIYRADTGELLRSCGGFSCSYTFNGTYGSAVGNPTFYYFARALNTQTGARVDSNIVNVYPRLSNNTNQNLTPWINMNTSRGVTSSPQLGDSVTITAHTNDQITSPAGTLSVVGPNGLVLRSCQNSSTCSYSFTMDTAMSNAMNGNVYNYIARWNPTSGGTYESVTLGIFPPSGSNNGVPATQHVLQVPTSVRPGESFTVTSRLFPDGTGSPYYTIRIFDQWNVLQHTCSRVRTCVLQQTLSQTSDTSRTYYATATSDSGQVLQSGNSTITVTQQNQTNYASRGNTIVTAGVESAEAISLTPYLTVNPNAPIRINLALQPTPSNVNGLTIKIYDEDGTTLLSTCENTSSCYYTKSAVNLTNQNRTISFKIRLEDRFGDWYQTYTPNVIVQTGSTFSTSLNTSINPSPAQSGQLFHLVAKAENYNIPLQNLGISWYQEENVSLVGNCYGLETCDIGTTYYANNGPRTMRFYAVAWDTTRARTGNVTSNNLSLTINP
ncbi:hypothetical protein KBD34_04585 [Patescibacteria group bacterium]|nr:hypothetical protein [Patescibacteria group bacterium]